MFLKDCIACSVVDLPVFVPEGPVEFHREPPLNAVKIQDVPPGEGATTGKPYAELALVDLKPQEVFRARRVLVKFNGAQSYKLRFRFGFLG